MRQYKSREMSKIIRWLIVLTIFDGICAQRCTHLRQEGQCKLFGECPPAQELWANAKSGGNGQLRDLQILTRACGYSSSNPLVCCLNDQPTVDNFGQSAPTPTRQSPFSRLQSASSTSGEDFSSHPNFRMLPSIEQCSNTPLSLRIIGGKTAPLGSYPWLARIGYLVIKSQRLVFGCAGSVITDKMVLTAAHCLDNLGSQLKPIMIRLAEHNVITDPDCFQNQCVSHQDFEIDRIIMHPDYKPNSKHNDIALIRIKGNIPFNDPFVQPVCLPFVDEYALKGYPHDLNNKKSVVAGFGKTKWNRAAGSSVLQHVELTILPNSVCQDEYARSSRIRIITNQVCAGGDLGKDSCDGDSGGPLMINHYSNHTTRHTKLIQVGIISYGPKQCGESGLPGVYTRVSEFRRWILDNLTQ